MISPSVVSVNPQECRFLFIIGKENTNKGVVYYEETK